MWSKIGRVYTDFTFLVKMKMRENYINYITYTRQFSDRTVIRHKAMLKDLDKFLSQYGKSVDDPESIKLADIYNFNESLCKRGLALGTQACIINAVRSYLRYCRDVQELNMLDISKVKSPKVPETEIGFFSKEDKQAILKLVNN